MILDSEISSIKTGWREIIENWKKENPDKWDKLNKNYEKGLETFPPKGSIFRCFDYFEAQDTRVVILGQDPYHGNGQAMGLCFGVHQDCKCPPSLRNINKELINDVGKSIEDRRDLVHWAEQGILMLNASLTVLEKCPGSHMKFWKEFTKYIMEYISEHCEISTMPTFQFYLNGKKVDELIGADTDELVQKLKQSYSTLIIKLQ